MEKRLTAVCRAGRWIRGVRGVPASAWALLLATFVLVRPAPAHGAPLHAPESSRWAILVAGISGDADLQKRYIEELTRLRDILLGPLEFRSENVFILVDEPEKAPNLGASKATREGLQKVCGDLAKRAGREDLVFVFLEGHGNYDGKTYKLNLVGPDPTAADLALMFNSIPAARFVVFNATTCSGGSIVDLAGRGRIIATSTKSGNEKNLTHTGIHFVDAFSDAAADGDRNGRISVLEAFNYARLKTERYYASEGNLQTEHPVLEDDGDAQAHDKPGPENGDGLLAAMTYLDGGAPTRLREGMTAEETALVREARRLETEIETLKYSKASMPPDVYEKTLESLLLRLAATNQKLRGKTEKP